MLGWLASGRDRRRRSGSPVIGTSCTRHRPGCSNNKKSSTGSKIEPVVNGWISHFRWPPPPPPHTHPYPEGCKGSWGVYWGICKEMGGLSTAKGMHGKVTVVLYLCSRGVIRDRDIPPARATRYALPHVQCICAFYFIYFILCHQSRKKSAVKNDCL